MSLSNRRKIMQLSKTVTDKIAAGEVVDRPISIVKELVENSIDADASSITIEIRNGGKTYIRITDNGSGIQKDDVETAFLRHATNKITTDADLNEIGTLGFRGEALASIAAVTKTELITKTTDDTTATKICIEGGIVTEKTGIGAQDGTTIIVTDLFYNTPARLKFLKPDHTESAQIIDFISKLALAYPKIKIRLINNGKILFSTSGKGDVFENIVMVYGKEMGENLIGFMEEDQNGTSITAFVSNPLYNKNTRKNQFFFLNGRYVSDKILEQAVSQGYGDKLMEGRYPVAFLFLQVPPETVDVNIHPNKKEVRFRHGEELKNFVAQSIFSNLDRKEAIPDAKAASIFRQTQTAVEKNAQTATQIKFKNQPKMPSNRDEPPVNIIKLSKPEQEEKILDVPAQFLDEVAERGSTYYPHRREKSGKTQDKVSANVQSGSGKEYDLDLKDRSSKKHDFNLEDLTVTGVVFQTYITAYDSEYFYLIDQHAAHERVFYEAFLAKFYGEENFPQMLLAPMVIQVSFAAKEECPDWLKFLMQAGFEIEEFGAKSYIIKAIPSFMTYEEAKGFIDDFIDSVSDTTDYMDRKTVEKIIMKSCKSAVKANDVLHEEEVTRLLSDLAKTENPYSCPHGRPVIVKLGKYELEKMFKRV